MPGERETLAKKVSYLTTRDSNMPLSKEDYLSIFDEISEGRSLRSALAKKGCGCSVFYSGLQNSKELTEQYAHARHCQAESSFEAVLHAVNDVYTGRLDANAGRVVIDTYKWIAARLKPAVYAEKTSLLGNVGDNTPTEITVRWASKPVELKHVNEENPQEFLKG
jgi:hypothetical protein